MRGFRVIIGSLVLLTALVAALAGSSQTTAAADAYTQVSAGGYLTCGLTTTGAIVCWGSLANVPAGSYTQVSTGELHTCGLTTAGAIVCGGDNRDGQADAPSGTFTQVEAGAYHTCGLTTAGSIVCWGENFDGQTDVPAGTYTQVEAGDYHTCGLTTARAIACWGLNTSGQTNVPAGAYYQVSAGGRHNCGQTTAGAVVCWGHDGYGRTAVPAGNYPQISAGKFHTCGLTTARAIVCWGQASSGPTDTPAETYSQVSSGGFHTCALTTTGDIDCWGENFNGQTNVPIPDDTAPAIIPSVAGVIGDNGWYTSDVTVSWTVTDDESTITNSTGCENTSVTTDTSELTVTCMATSDGGTSSESVTIKRDATAPALAPVVTPNPVAANQPAMATANAADATSGIASQNCQTPDTSTAGERSVNCTATDNAGNTAATQASYTITDPSAPVITPGVNGALGDNGWYTSDVTVTWTVTDAESAFTGTSGCDPTTVTTDTSGTVLTCSATSAGGTSSHPVTVMRDATAPVVTFTGNQATYGLTDTVTIVCAASDATSGIASDTCQDVSAPAASFDPGEHVITAEATDLAGNTGSAETPFVVTASHDGLCALTKELVSHRSTERAACALLTAAELAEQRGQAHLEAGLLANYRVTIAVAIWLGDLSAEDGQTLIDWSRTL